MSQNSKEPLSEQEEQALPEAPFPRKYILCVFDDLDDAKQAEQALQNAGIAGEDIYVLNGQQFTEAMTRAQSPWHVLSSLDNDAYVQHARHGRTILSVPFNGHEQEQMVQIRDLLIPYHARLMKYIDTWTTMDLIP